jgi:hypothetical protein
MQWTAILLTFANTGKSCRADIQKRQFELAGVIKVAISVAPPYRKPGIKNINGAESTGVL